MKEWVAIKIKREVVIKKNRDGLKENQMRGSLRVIRAQTN